MIVAEKRVKPAKTKTRKNACGVISVETEDKIRYQPGAVQARAYRSGPRHHLGLVIAHRTRGQLRVQWASVNEPRCGVGTRLYEALATYACKHGLTMTSDRSLSHMSQGFWLKQVKKGRARWDKRRKRFILHDACIRSLAGTTSRRTR